MTGGAAPAEAPLVVNGWSIFAHPVFLDQLEELIEEVEARKVREPQAWHKKNCTKRLAAIFKLVTENIPADPGAPAFRQGNTLGENRKHWFRAKFFQQYRLFFRFDSTAKVIVLAWVNNEQTLRAYPRQHELAVALREIGRVERTLFIIDWLLDADMQRRAQIGLNKGKGRIML